MASGRSSETFRYLLLALIAPAASLFCRWFTWADPQHVLLYPDPDYGYLFNSLLILDGYAPWHIDHPGTPIQLIGALMMKLRFALAGTAPELHADFFLDPVGYHQWAVHPLFALFLGAQFFSCFKLLRLKVPALLAVAACLLPLTFFDLIDYFDHVSPECLLAGVCILAVPFLLEAARGGVKAAIAAGALLGVACTLKATALPLLLCLFVLPSRRERIWGAAAAACFYLGITAPLWSEFPRLLGWYFNLGTRPGVYGQGSGGPTSGSQLAANLGFLFSGGQWNSNFPALLLFPLLLWLPSPRAIRRWPIGLAAAVLLLLILKHPATRYILPFLTVGMLAFLRAESQARWKQALLALLLLAPAPFLLYMPLRGKTLWRAGEAEASRMLEERLASPAYKDCTVTVVNELAHTGHALLAGNFATKTENYGTWIRSVYPRVSFIFGQVRFPGSIPKPAEWQAYLASAPCHVFIGRPPRAEANVQKAFGVEPTLIELLGESGNAGIYRVGETRLLALPAKQTFELAPPVGPLVSPTTP